MSQTIESIALLRFVLRDNCNTDEIARRYLGDAARLGVDPLDYCAHRFGLGNENGLAARRRVGRLPVRDDHSDAHRTPAD